MKMSCTILWGILLILLGTGLILNLVFHLNIPVFKLMIGLFIVYIGIRIIIGRNIHCCGSHNHRHDVIFGESNFNSFDDWQQNEKNVIFGSAVIDLSKMTLDENKIKHIKINTVFGGTKLKLRKDMPVKIKIDAAFAGSELPGGNQVPFGTSNYSNIDASRTTGYLEIEASVVFGGLKIELVE